jgi:tetratricopeptide (TPR) repeat protein
MSSTDRQLGVDLFNGTWRLIESREDDERMLHMAHASAYHWSIAPECKPENRARSEWLVARVYTLLGRPEPALDHAQRCLQWCEEHGVADWDLAYAYEALARAHRLAGDEAAAERFLAEARAVEIADAEDREHLDEDLATV